MRDSTHAGYANMQKYFQFEAILNSPVVRNCRILTGFCK